MSTVLRKVKLKNYLTWLITGLMLLLFGACAQASGTAGSIRIQLPKEQAPEVELTLYMVADYQEDGTLAFVSEFADCDASLAGDIDASQAQQITEQLAMVAKERNMQGTAKRADRDGVIVYSDLAPACYMVLQTAGEDALEVQKMLVPIPYMEEDGALVYDAVVAPKYEIPVGAAILNKVDDAGTAVGSAKFVLQRKVYITENSIMPVALDVEYGQDAGGRFVWDNYINDLVTDEYGQLVLTNLPLAMYRLVEVEAPPGFILNSAPQYFEITKEGQVYQRNHLYVPQTDAVPELQLENTRTSLLVNKVDENGKSLPGATLVIMDADDVGITDENGAVKYEIKTGVEPVEVRQVPPGDYYLCEIVSPEGYHVAADVPFTISAEPDAVNTVTMVDEKEKRTVESLTVTKHLHDAEDDTLVAVDSVFYVALFDDPERTNRVSDVKELHFVGSSSASATFLNLEPGKPYYVGETDAFGVFMESGEIGNAVYSGEYPDGYEVTVTDKNPDAELSIYNLFYDIPDDFYVAGELTFVKQVLLNGEAHDTNDVFYAAMFEDEAMTKRYGDVITLDMNGGSMASVTVDNIFIGETPDSSKTYYLAETDANGKVLNAGSGLTFTISMDKTEVTMSGSNSSESVTITNEFTEKETEPETEDVTEITTEVTSEITSEEELTEEETEKGRKPVPSSGDSSSGSNTPDSNNPVRTGDDTPIAMYIALLAAAAVIIAVVLIVKKKKKK